MALDNKKIFQGDKGIWRIMLFLGIYSSWAVFSASSQLAYDAFSINAGKYLFRQLIILGIGTTAAVILHHVPFKYFSKPSIFFWYLSIFLLVVTLIWGLNINDARRWLLLPGDITFQTSDFAKITLLVYLARNLSLKEEENKNIKAFLKNIYFPILLTTGLIMIADLSTALILYAVSMILVFVSKTSFKNFVVSILISMILVLGMIGLIKAFPDYGRFSTWNNRIDSYMDPSKPENIQQVHSKIAVATGGLFGKGVGKSIQRNILPNPNSDYIFAIITEEMGLVIGVLPVIALYIFLLARSKKIIKKTSRKFGCYLTAGMSVLIASQAFANMAVATNLFPVTGQPLPYVSYGGTSIFFTGIAFGIILSVSREIEEKNSEKNENTQDNISLNTEKTEENNEQTITINN